MEWQTYVADGAPPLSHPLSAARRRRAKEIHGLYKVVLTGVFARTPCATVGPGNHYVLMEGAAQDRKSSPVRLARIPATVATVAHFPVRSVAQLLRKVRNGWPAHVATNPIDPLLAYPWRQLHDEFDANVAPDAARFREIAVNYGAKKEHWQPVSSVCLVEDPLPATTILRYSALARDDS